MTEKPRIPHAATTGNVWPALPGEKGRSVLALMYQFEQSQWWAPSDISRLQFRQLTALLHHAWENVPFHRRRLEDAGLEPPFEDLAETWSEIPSLRRRDIQDAGTDIHALALPDDHGSISDIHTSGSTGKPIRALRTRLALLFWSAFTLRDHLWHRRNLTGTLAVIRNSAPDQDPYPDGSSFKFWGSSRRAFDTGPCIALNITCTVEQHMDWMRRKNPEYLLTHPTILHRMAEYAIQEGIEIPRLKQVQTISEILRPETREACREAWGVEITDNYSGREVGYIALQCPDHEHYHVQSEGCLVEVVKEDGTACAPGEIGRVLVTPMHNFAMPFLRYEVGDFAEVGEPCPCGRGLPVLKRILGREQNLLVLPNGDKRWTLLSEGSIRKLLKMAPIQEYQFIQKSVEEIEIRLVAARDLEKGEEENIRRWAVEKFQHPFKITFAYMETLPRGRTGKLQDFVSEVA